jgi:hypothetical protein
VDRTVCHTIKSSCHVELLVVAAVPCRWYTVTSARTAYTMAVKTEIVSFIGSLVSNTSQTHVTTDALANLKNDQTLQHAQ